MEDTCTCPCRALSLSHSLWLKLKVYELHTKMEIVPAAIRVCVCVLLSVCEYVCVGADNLALRPNDVDSGS